MPKKYTRAKAMARLRKLREMLDEPDADLKAIEAEISEIETALENLEDAAEGLADAAEGDGQEEQRDTQEEKQDGEEGDGQDGDREERDSQARRRAQLRARMAAGAAGIVTRNFKDLEGSPVKTIYTIESPEYRTGLLKKLLGQDMTSQERNAVSYVATTGDATNGAANVLPRQMLDSIWDLIEEQHAILGDITLYRTGTIMEIAVRTAITQGDAATVNENAANDDEINNFIKVTLSGKDFSKHVELTYAMAKMSLDAFEGFLVSEIADRMGAALAADVVAQINTDYASSTNAINSAAVKKLAFTDVAAAMAVLENAKGQCVVYAKRATIYNYLVGMVDTTGRPIFQVNAQEGQEGALIGCPVKVEDAVAANVLLIGYPQQVAGNMIQDIMVESDKDIKKHVIVHSGYARFECKLIAPKAFAKLTVKQS